MIRRPTLRDRLHGVPPDVAAFGRTLTPRLTDQLLGIVWSAYDVLLADVFSRLDWDEEYEDLERTITEDLADEIGKEVHSNGGFLPVGFRHVSYEREGRSPAPAQPREYDLAFYYHADKRLMWPLEAKLLHTDANTLKNLGDYVDTVTARYLACAYAPYAPSGVMLAYLKQGNADILLDHVSDRLGVELRRYASFPMRAHQTSDHVRTVPPEKPYPLAFCCHHLVMPLRISTPPAP